MRNILQRLVLLAATSVAACGGGAHAPDFTLSDDGGHIWTLSGQQGKAVLLTFGFTHCTDTCPATLAKLARIAESSQRRAGTTEIAFVTIDPARDTVPVVHRFVARFAMPGDTALVGLTGTAAQIERVESAYHVWSAPTAHGMAHTAVVFFIDPRGRIRSMHDDDDSEASLSRALAQTLAPQ